MVICLFQFAYYFCDHNLKPIEMKKVFAILTLAAFVVACNNESTASTEEANKKAADSARIADSIKAEQDKAAAAAADTTTKADTTVKN